MEGLMILVVGIAVLVVAGLAIKISLLSAKLDGIREAQQRVNNGNLGYGMGNGGTVFGCLQAFAFIGFLALCALSAYFGAVLF